MKETITQPNLLAIVGPTAVGKTALSIEIGQALDGEIISADSRQIYQMMDIGTAKATPEEQQALPHHLIDMVAPDGNLTLAHYVERASAAVHEINGRGRLPILVGGTGLYVRALLEGWTVPEVAPDAALREALAEVAEKQGIGALHAQLATVDPQAAENIDARNVRRVIRALEVYHVTGQPITELQRKNPPAWSIVKVGLTMPREQLYRRIDDRIDDMMDRGLEQEVRALAQAGYDWRLPSMSALGYRQLGQYIRGEVSLREAVALIRRHTRKFVRQQYNWFQLVDESIHWLDLSTMTTSAAAAKICQLVKGALGESGG